MGESLFREALELRPLALLAAGRKDEAIERCSSRGTGVCTRPTASLIGEDPDAIQVGAELRIPPSE